MIAVLLAVLLLMMGGCVAGAGTSATITITANLTCNGTIYAPCPGMPIFDPVNNTTVEVWPISS